MKIFKKVVGIALIMMLSIITMFESTSVKAAGKISPEDSTLRSLSINKTTLIPRFSSSITEYDVYVNNDTAYVDVKASLSNSKANFTVNGDEGTNGKSLRIDLEGSKTIIKIVVTSENEKNDATYTVTVNRAEANDTSLANLMIIGSDVEDIHFDSKKTDYEMKVPNSCSSVKVIPTAADSSAKITINKKIIRSGSQYSASLNTGRNTIEIVVTNGGESQTYKINIDRSKNDNSYLKSLLVKPGIIDDRFNKADFDYEITLRDSDSTASVTPIAEDRNAKIEVISEKLNYIQKGSKYDFTIKNPGTYNIRIVVTAEDEDSKTTYNLKVLKPSPSDNTLSKIIIGENELINPFNAESTYEMTVNNEVERLAILAIPNNPNSAVKTYVNQKSAGSSRVNASLGEGLNIIKIEVFSNEKNIKERTSTTYIIKVTRLPQPIMNITEIGYLKEGSSVTTALTKGKILLRDNVYQIDLSNLGDGDIIRYIKVQVPESSYTTALKLLSGKEMNLIKGINEVSDLSILGNANLDGEGISVGNLRANADGDGYFSVYAEILGDYQGTQISKNVIFKTKLKPSERTNGKNSIVESAVLNLSNGSTIIATADRNRTKYTFDFSDLDVPLSSVKAVSIVVNVNRECKLKISGKTIDLKVGDGVNVLKPKDIGLPDNGDDGVTLSLIRGFGNVSQSCTIIDGVKQYNITIYIKW